MSNTVNILALLVSSAVSLRIAFYAWRRRTAPGATAFTATALACSFWMLVYLFEITSQRFSTKVFWDNLHLLLGAVLPGTLLLFVIGFTRRSSRLSPLLIIFFFIQPAITLVIMLAGDPGGMIRRNASLTPAQGLFTTLTYAYGGWYWVTAVFSALLFLVSVLLLAEYIWHGSSLYREQAAILLFATLIPLAASLFSLLQYPPFNRDYLVHISFAFGIVLIAWALFRYRFLDISPLAHEVIIDNLQDGVIVIDHQNQLVDINQSARDILQVNDHLTAGLKLEEAIPNWIQTINAFIASSQTSLEVKREAQGRHYELTGTLLKNQHGNPLGRIIVIRDITIRKQAEEMAQQAHQLAEESTNELAILFHLAETLNQTLTPEKALEAGLELVAKQFNAQAGWFLTLTSDNKAVLAAAYNIPPYLDLAVYKDQAWPLCLCLRETLAGRLENPIRVVNCERMERVKDLQPELPRHHLSIPVRAAGEVVGIFNLVLSANQTYDETEIKLLSAIGDQFGGAIERARLFREVHILATTDALTGLNNRRHFFELAEIEIARVMRYHHPLSVAMLDVGHFKKINDNYGHLTGDQVLKVVAQICKREVRKIDILGRYGGEEIIILMPETTQLSALQAMERLRQTIEAASIDSVRGAISATVSIGMASLTESDSLDLEKLIDRADQALYQAKNSGRNQVRTWEKAVEGNSPEDWGI